jgi:hypothetical protein
MNKKNLSLAGIVILASILSSCDLTGAGSGSDSNVRQSSLTISETPLFYYKATTSNQYYLTLSNNTDQQLSLVDSGITNSSLAESIDFRSMVDTSECNKLAAKSNCRLRVKLPYANNEGYYSFRINYQANDGTDISVDKVIAFSSSLPESGGLVSSQKFIDTVAVNSDRFTLALPIILDRDYSAIKLEVGNKNERSAYSKIVCDTQGGYKQNSSCTALVELDGHIADPQLRLSTTDTNDHINSYNFVTGVVYNNQAHLVYLNAPLIVRSGSSGLANVVTVLNIGTLLASNLKTVWSNPSNLSLTQTSSCSSGGTLRPNASCTITYTPTTPATPVFGYELQNVEYSGGALSTTKDRFYVYRNKAGLQTPKVVSITPAKDNYVAEVRPQIKVTFSEPVDSDTVDNNSFYLKNSSGQQVNGTISWIENNIIAFIPTNDLLKGGQYTINLATDKIGNSAGKISTSANAVERSLFTIFSPATNFVFDMDYNIKNQYSQQYVDIRGGDFLDGTTILQHSLNFTYQNQKFRIIKSNNSQLNKFGSPYHIVSGYNTAKGLHNQEYDDFIVLSTVNSAEPRDNWYIHQNLDNSLTFINAYESALAKSLDLAACNTDNGTWLKLQSLTSSCSGGTSNKWSLNPAAIVTVQASSPTNIMMGDSFNFTASIDVGSSLVTAAFANPLDGVITSNPASCDLNAAGTKSCIFSALVWNTSIANGSTFNPRIIVSATNDARVIGSPLILTVVSSSTVYLPATGQTKITPFAATEGMDGWYQAGIKIDDSTRFTVGTGAQANCITDNLTGLMWIKDLNTVNSAGGSTWQGAISLIDKANRGSGYCGHRDWYLPAVNELQSLNNYGRISMDTWLTGQGFMAVKPDYYWSSTSYAPNSSSAWYVFFSYGNVNASTKTGNYYVWPVRRVP